VAEHLLELVVEMEGLELQGLILVTVEVAVVVAMQVLVALVDLPVVGIPQQQEQAVLAVVAEE
jgi:hypothetical protein